MYVESTLLPDEVLTERSTSSGYAKRRRLTQLPRVFYVWEVATNTISGVFRLSHCSTTAEAADVHWQCDRVVSLNQPVQLDDDEFNKRGTFFEITQKTELVLRNMSVLAGGDMKNHFVDDLGSRWSAWPVDRALLVKLASNGGGPCTFSTPAKYARDAGVDPAFTRSVSDYADCARRTTVFLNVCLDIFIFHF